MNRSSGILNHITSLPSKYGIGSFGKEVKNFAHLLKESGTQYWQVLPFTPIDTIYSPYRSESAFAGNPLLIDLEDLHERDLITDEELASCVVDEDWKVDFPRVMEDRDRVFKLAYSRIDDDLKKEIHDFIEQNPWLTEYVLYKGIKSKFETPWYEWPEEFRDRDPKIIEATRKLLEDEIMYYGFLQYLFYTQWLENKEYINDLGIKIIGDIPMYVSDDSADVWSNRDIFEMEGNTFPNVAGVPPDFFSADGQLWGNPLYNWDKLKENGYQWWLDRLDHSLELYDLLRFDHFRALSTYYAIPGDEDTARNGVWRNGPKMDFLGKVIDKFGNDVFIAEDLGGELAPDVMELLEESGLPGMRLTQMAFTPYGVNEVHFPRNYTNHHIGYLGTHDNNTFLGWLKNDITEEQRRIALEDAGLNPDEINLEDLDINNDVIKTFVERLWETDALASIIQIQDALGLDKEARMNTPATKVDNWEFKLPSEALEQLDIDWLRELNQKYDRMLEE